MSSGWYNKNGMNLFSDKTAVVILGIGIAFAFLYSGIASISNPLAWIGFVPSFVGTFIAPSLFLRVFAAFEILLGLWLLSGYKKFYAAIISFLILIAIVLPNIVVLDLTFRDITIACAALALAVLSKKK